MPGLATFLYKDKIRFLILHMSGKLFCSAMFLYGGFQSNEYEVHRCNVMAAQLNITKAGNEQVSCSHNLSIHILPILQDLGIGGKRTFKGSKRGQAPDSHGESM